MADLGHDRSGPGGYSRRIGHVVVLAVGLGLIATGYQVAAFEVAARQLRDQLTAASAQPRSGHLEALADQAGRWTGSALLPVRSASLALDVELAASPPDTVKAQRVLENLLAAKPAYAAGWQSRADLEAINGASLDAALASWRMSFTLGPNEGLVMLQRAMFGIEQWPNLPQADRERVVHDLVAALTFDFDAYQYSIFQGVLKAMAAPVRQELIEAVRLRGPAAAKALGRMGVS